MQFQTVAGKCAVPCQHSSVVAVVEKNIKSTKHIQKEPPYINSQDSKNTILIRENKIKVHINILINYPPLSYICKGAMLRYSPLLIRRTIDFSDF